MKKEVTVKRAFMLSATLPGAGEWYAGEKSRGLFSASVIFGALALFGYSTATTVQKAMNQLGASLDGASPTSLDVPVLSLSASMLVAYGMWLYTMYGSIEAASAKDESERTAGWALVLSYVCPGTGQVYVGSPLLGQVLFYTFFAGIMLGLASYRTLITELQALAQGGALASATPHTVPDLLALPLAKVSFSLGQMLQSMSRMAAIYFSFDAIGRERRLPLWDGLVGLAGTWFCPGAGHLLMKKGKWGSRFFKGTLATMAALATMVYFCELPAIWVLSSITWLALIHYLYTWQTMDICQKTDALCQSNVEEMEESDRKRAINKEVEPCFGIGTACAS